MTAAEVVSSTDAPEGSGVPLAPIDGAFDGNREAVGGNVDPLGIKGRQLVFVRAQNEAGDWGPATAQWVKG